jgi:hypothetical protein
VPGDNVELQAETAELMLSLVVVEPQASFVRTEGQAHPSYSAGFAAAQEQNRE